MTEKFNEFIERVQTFNFLKWVYKSQKLNPYKLARHGFINSGINELQCQCCKNKIIFNEKQFEEEKSIEESVEQFQKYCSDFLLNCINIHEKECFFHTVKTNLFKISRQFLYSEWELFYQNNLNSFEDHDYDLESIGFPIINPSFYELIPTEMQVVYMDQNEDNSILYSKNFNVKKVCSIFGWQLQIHEVFTQPSQSEKQSKQIENNQQQQQSEEPEQQIEEMQTEKNQLENVAETKKQQEKEGNENNNEEEEENNPDPDIYLFCQFCGRKFNVKYYKTKEGLHQNLLENKRIQEQMKNQNDSQSQNLFDVIQEHQYFCKWGKIDKISNKIFGWNICLQYLYEEIKRGNSKQQKLRDKEMELQKIKLDFIKQNEEVNKLKEEQLKKFEEISNKYLKYNLEEENLFSKKTENLTQIFNDFDQNLKDTSDFTLKKIKMQ